MHRSPILEGGGGLAAPEPPRCHARRPRPLRFVSYASHTQALRSRARKPGCAALGGRGAGLFRFTPSTCKELGSSEYCVPTPHAALSRAAPTRVAASTPPWTTPSISCFMTPFWQLPRRVEVLQSRTGRSAACPAASRSSPVRGLLRCFGQAGRRIRARSRVLGCTPSKPRHCANRDAPKRQPPGARRLGDARVRGPPTARRRAPARRGAATPVLEVPQAAASDGV
jgi:hypothetical protein